jgi:nicotinamide-nucleotide amidase
MVKPPSGMGILQHLIHSLRSRHQKLGLAESCTGGKLSARIVEQAGVSDNYCGSAVTYSDEAKVEMLGVRRETLRDHGAVSSETAREMAMGTRSKLKCDWAVAITGIAGPTGGTENKPVGTVHFSVSGPGFDSQRKKVFTGTRIEIQEQSVDFALEFLAGAISGAEAKS